MFVLGMHRSQTSLVTGLIRMMGAYVGPLGRQIPASPDNRKGYFERWDVIAINDALLSAHGCSWNDVASWPMHAPTATGDSVTGQIRRLVSEMDRHCPWVIKDPRLCLTFPHWRPHLPAVLPIVVSRDPRHVAWSLVSRDGVTFEHALALWEFYVVSLMNALGNVDRVCVRAEEALTCPLVFVRELHNRLTRAGIQGLHLPKDGDVKEFVDASLVHALPLEDGSPLDTRHLWLRAALQNERGTNGANVSAEAMSILHRGSV